MDVARSVGMLEGLLGCWKVCRDVGRSVRMLDGL